MGGGYGVKSLFLTLHPLPLLTFIYGPPLENVLSQE